MLDIYSIIEFSALIKLFVYLLPLFGQMAPGQERQVAASIASYGKSEPEIRGTEDEPGGGIGGTATDEEPTRVNPEVTLFDEQCYLIESIRRFVIIAQNRNNGAPYRNFTEIDELPGNLVSRLNHDPNARSLLDITPDVQALLVPSIRLYRVDYDKSSPVKPIAQQEIPFENHTSRYEIDNIRKNRSGRGAGAGLKSMTWGLKGVNPAEVDNNIVVELKMFFQGVEDLFGKNLVMKNGKSTEQYAAGQKDQAGFLDLIISSPGVDDSGDRSPETPTSTQRYSCANDFNEIYEGTTFRIKAIVGWEIPDKKQLENIPSMTKQKAKNLWRALKSQQKTLFLQQTRHNIEFRQDGTLILTAQYHAALTGILTSRRADLFYLSKEDKERRSAELAAVKEKHGRTDETEEDYNEEYDAAVAALEREQLIDKTKKYRVFLRRLYEAKKIYYVDEPVQTLMAGNFTSMTPGQRSEYAHQRAGNITSTQPTLSGGQSASSAVVDAALQESLAGDGTNPGEPFDDAIVEISELVDKKPATVVRVYFFYFGDLIDIVLDHIKDHIDADAFNILIGTIEMIDPLVALAAKTNIKESIACGTARTASVQAVKDSLYGPGAGGNLIEHFPISGIPISLNLFNRWFLKNVVKRGKENYYIAHFLRDIFSSLIIPAINSKCEIIKSSPARLSMTNLLIDGRDDGKSPLPRGGRPLSYAGLKDLLPGLGGIGHGSISVSSHTNIKNTIPVLVFYAPTSMPQARTGKESDDFKEGIYHFHIGASAGLLKSLPFSRADQPMLRESKIAKRGALGAEQLRELYHCNLKLYGNTLLKPGQYIYVNPMTIGSGNAKARSQILSTLGLGGYYLVVDVENIIEIGNFETNIKALHQFVRIGTNETAGISTRPREELPAPEENPHETSPGASRGGDEYRGLDVGGGTASSPDSSASNGGRMTPGGAESGAGAPAMQVPVRQADGSFRLTLQVPEGTTPPAQPAVPDQDVPHRPLGRAGGAGAVPDWVQQMKRAKQERGY